MADHPEAEVLFWVGCMPSFEDRAKKVTVAFAKLMQAAGVDFAILGVEETCTGDAARRAGNEYLFQMFAQQNVEILNGYGVDKKLIVTTCPHCLNTLKNEYPRLRWPLHRRAPQRVPREAHSRGQAQADEARGEEGGVPRFLLPGGGTTRSTTTPRQVLRRIPGLTLVEPDQTRDRGLCCGAGGAQMFKEEEEGEMRVSHQRTDQLLATDPAAMASGCPFCTRMLTDSLADKDLRGRRGPGHCRGVARGGGGVMRRVAQAM